MSQEFKANSGGKEPSKTPYIKPKLAAALASLEVQLDQELARYRRTRLNERKPNQGHFWKTATNKSAQLNNVVTKLEHTPASESENTSTEELTVQSLASGSEVNKNIPSSALPQVNPQASSSSRDKTQKLETDSLEVDLPKEKQNSNELNLKTAPNSSPIVPTKKTKQKQTKTLPGEQTIIQSPEDYLESSEELLRSFSAEQKSTKKSAVKTDGLLTPLGIASMMLLLVACSLVGWAAANPGELPKLSFGSLFKQNSDDNPEDPIVSGSSRTLTQPSIPKKPIPKKPNLAAQEFPEVKNPGDVVNLRPKAQLTPNPSPEALPSPTSQITVGENSSQASNEATSNTTVQTPQVTEEKQETQSDADIKPSADGFYHVVVDNLGVASVTQAQQVVPDAYISDDGKLIHLGALKTKERAQKLLTELKSKGLEAKIK